MHYRTHTLLSCVAWIGLVASGNALAVKSNAPSETLALLAHTIGTLSGPLEKSLQNDGGSSSSSTEKNRRQADGQINEQDPSSNNNNNNNVNQANGFNGPISRAPQNYAGGPLPFPQFHGGGGGGFPFHQSAGFQFRNPYFDQRQFAQNAGFGPGPQNGFPFDPRFFQRPGGGPGPNQGQFGFGPGGGGGGGGVAAANTGAAAAGPNVQGQKSSKLTNTSGNVKAANNNNNNNNNNGEGNKNVNTLESIEAGSSGDSKSSAQNSRPFQAGPSFPDNNNFNGGVGGGNFGNDNSRYPLDFRQNFFNQGNPGGNFDQRFYNSFNDIPFSSGPPYRSQGQLGNGNDDGRFINNFNNGGRPGVNGAAGGGGAGGAGVDVNGLRPDGGLGGGLGGINNPYFNGFGPGDAFGGGGGAYPQNFNFNPANNLGGQGFDGPGGPFGGGFNNNRFGFSGQPNYPGGGGGFNNNFYPGIIRGGGGGGGGVGGIGGVGGGGNFNNGNAGFDDGDSTLRSASTKDEQIDQEPQVDESTENSELKRMTESGVVTTADAEEEETTTAEK